MHGCMKGKEAIILCLIKKIKLLYKNKKYINIFYYLIYKIYNEQNKGWTT